MDVIRHHDVPTDRDIAFLRFETKSTECFMDFLSR
jgi:hypothetical protein